MPTKCTFNMRRRTNLLRAVTFRFDWCVTTASTPPLWKYLGPTISFLRFGVVDCYIYPTYCNRRALLEQK